MVFVGLAALSTVTVGSAARNYLEFFPAMEGVTVKIASAEAQTVEQGHKIVVLFILENPTGYSGLSIKSFQISVTFQDTNGTLIPYGQPAAEPSAKIPIAPNSSLDFTRDVPLPGSWRPIAEGFISGELLARFRVSISLSTFLDTLSLIILNYQCVLGIAYETPLECRKGPTTAVSPRVGGGA